MSQQHAHVSLSCPAQAITALLRLAPSTATLLVRDERGQTVREEEVPSALIQRGDLLKVGAALGACSAAWLVDKWSRTMWQVADGSMHRCMQMNACEMAWDAASSLEAAKEGLTVTLQDPCISACCSHRSLADVHAGAARSEGASRRGGSGGAQLCG